jgi:Domain of unknown function (DUF1996)
MLTLLVNRSGGFPFSIFLEKGAPLQRVRRNLVSAISKRTAAEWAGMVAGTVLVVVVAMALVSGQGPAGAQSEEDVLTGPTLQFGCNVLKVAAIDPIFDPEHPHDHVFYGNTGVDADSTYESLVNNKHTTCANTYATSSYWNPVVKDGTTEVNQPRRLSVYYVGRGDQTKVQPIPDGLQLLGNNENGKVEYRCGAEPAVTSPPYGCTAEEFRIKVHFPDCWDRSSLQPDSLVRMSGGACPSSHPYQIPTVRMSVHYGNVGGVLKGPLMVSAGHGEFLGADFFHADVFAAPQEPAFRDTIRKCVNNVADGTVPPAACRPGLRPDTTLAPSGPSGTMASGSGTFTFSSPEPDATFQCRVYAAGTTPGSFGTCSGNGTHDVSGLANGTYSFEVRAVEPFSQPFSAQEDPTPASRTWTVDPAAATTIAAPTNLTATLGGTRSRPQITLRWTDNSNNEDNFVVERFVDNGTTWKVLTSSLAANTTRYTDKSVVSGGKRYTYRIKATKSAVSSAYSNQASATTR